MNSFVALLFALTDGVISGFIVSKVGTALYDFCYVTTGGPFQFQAKNPALIINVNTE